MQHATRHSHDAFDYWARGEIRMCRARRLTQHKSTCDAGTDNARTASAWTEADSIVKPHVNLRPDFIALRVALRPLLQHIRPSARQGLGPSPPPICSSAHSPAAHDARSIRCSAHDPRLSPTRIEADCISRARGMSRGCCAHQLQHHGQDEYQPLSAIMWHNCANSFWGRC